MAYILICFSVLIIQGHNVVIHHHDEPNEHHNTSHATEEGHNVFSLVDFYSEFIPQDQIDTQTEITAINSSALLEIVLCKSGVSNIYISKNEYPPPAPTTSFKSLRAPPINLFC